MIRLSATKKMTLGAMVIALTVLSLYAASVLPWSKLACCFLSSIFVYALTCEGAYGTALLTYIASAGAAFLLLPDKAPFYLYAVLLGHFGIFKTFIEEKVQDKPMRFLLKLIYCNVFMGGAAAVGMLVFGLELASYLPGWAFWVLLAVLEAGFVAYDLLYSLCEKIYINGIRSKILPRR